MGGVQKTYAVGPPRADLIKEDFDTLIYQKGRSVVHETALQCPCKSPSTNQQSNCKNCGGSGWIFINPVTTRMVLTGVNVVTDYKPWSEEMRGTVNVSCHAEQELSFMDRITALDGEAIFNEVLFFKKKASQIFTYLTYPVKSILYIGMYIDVNTPLRRLVEGTDYTLEGKILRLLNSSLLISDPTGANTSFTVRYKHAPQFHVIEMKRETIQTFEWQGTESLKHLPVAAIARRAHYQLDAKNLTSNNLLDNSYETNSICPVPIGREY